MSRTRMLKPDFFSSRSLSRVSRDARLMFQGLWCEADSVGRGKADPRIVKGAVFPLDDDLTLGDIDAMLLELANTGHITLYEVDDEPLYEVVNFEKHQAASYRTGAAKFAGPGDGTTRHADCTTTHADCTTSRALSEVKGSEEKCASDDAHDFDAFWSSYPRKVDKKRARTAWKNMTQGERDAATDALPAHLDAWKSTKPEHIPHPTTWLHGKRWEDEIEPRTRLQIVERDGVLVDPYADW